MLNAIRVMLEFEDEDEGGVRLLDICVRSALKMFGHEPDQTLDVTAAAVALNKTTIETLQAGRVTFNAWVVTEDLTNPAGVTSVDAAMWPSFDHPDWTAEELDRARAQKVMLVEVVAFRGYGRGETTVETWAYSPETSAWVGEGSKLESWPVPNRTESAKPVSSAS